MELLAGCLDDLVVIAINLSFEGSRLCKCGWIPAPPKPVHFAVEGRTISCEHGQWRENGQVLRCRNLRYIMLSSSRHKGVLLGRISLGDSN